MSTTEAENVSSQGTLATAAALDQATGQARPTLLPSEKLATAAALDQATRQAAPPRTPAPTRQPVAAAYSWWNEAVFYEVFVRSFKDSNGDGVGDINGLIEMLDYLNDGDPSTTTDLGVTGLWLMPVTESPSYHGYDVVDYYTIDQEYGTNDDFKRLMAEAHRRGIRVIVDLVLNHTSTENTWFQKSDAGDPEYRDWYIWEAKSPGFLGPWGQQVWYPGRDGYYYAIFWSGMPDLNLQNPAVIGEIQQITRYWLEDLGVDGFRMDAVRHFVEQGAAQENTPDTHVMLQAFHRFYKSVNPDAFTVGEAWTDTSHVIDYIGDEMDIAFEFDLAEAFVRAAAGPLASSAANQMQVVLDHYPPGQFATFLTNHDQDRTMSVLGGDVAKARLAATMLLTSPGVPFLYYGEEIGLTGTKPDEDIRRPMQWDGASAQVGFTSGTPWRAASPDYETVHVAGQTADPDSLLSLYRNLIMLRNSHAALRTGETLVVETGSQRLYALLRYDDAEAFLILINVHPRPLMADQYRLSLPAGPFTGPLQAVTVFGPPDPAAPAIHANGGFDTYQPFLEIPAQSSVIIHLLP
ncbi:MAG: alpha-amylase family glycosyl hydrolase [Chloroflexota bacterium]